MCKINVFLLILLTFFTFSTGIFDFLFPKCVCSCGTTRENRILGGQPNQNEFPWIAQLIAPQKIISGTLINDKYIITSASLVIGLTPYDVKVTLGFFDRCTPESHTTNFSVTSIIIHRDFSTTNKINDLSLVKLNTDVKLDNYPTVCLTSKFENFDGIGIVLGWNNNGNTNGLGYCKRLKLKLPILTFFECFSTTKREYFTSDKGCVGIIGAISGVCKNDAGGGVVVKNKHGSYELLGVLSDENVCGNPPSTALYTKISSHLNWIKENTNDACYCTN
ncbi:trypsin-1-like isoform X1 [Onthophagus taurus]|uniref:trypsin-1-like isoform X1 n=1 Tax=Onthophagus taurus TaxID=166361 RepID=UPI0039BEAB73